MITFSEVNNIVASMTMKQYYGNNDNEWNNNNIMATMTMKNVTTHNDCNE